MLVETKLVTFSENYWSSTENADNDNNAWNYNFNGTNSNMNNNNKDNANNHVRPVLAYQADTIFLIRE